MAVMLSMLSADPTDVAPVAILGDRESKGPKTPKLPAETETGTPASQYVGLPQQWDVVVSVSLDGDHRIRTKA